MQNLGEWNLYIIRLRGETGAGESMLGVRHCNRGSVELEFWREFEKERKGHGSRVGLGSLTLQFCLGADTVVVV